MSSIIAKRQAKRQAAEDRKYYALAFLIIAPQAGIIGAIVYSMFHPHSVVAGIISKMFGV